MTDIPHNNIEEFLKIATGSREVGIVIAKDSAELGEFSKSMDSAEFKRAEGISDLFQSPKVYAVVDENLDKDIYDFVVQYPTGQVEIFDQKLSTSHLLSPDYINSGIVILVLKEDLTKLEEKGFNLLSTTGPALQL